MAAVVRWWQSDRTKYQLTCAHDRGHRPLYPIDDGTRVVLQCRDCGYRREVPRQVVRAYGEWFSVSLNWLLLSVNASDLLHVA